MELNLMIFQMSDFFTEFANLAVLRVLVPNLPTCFFISCAYFPKYLKSFCVLRA